ncbi:MaoC/PaaZ C-terminal domain-containing protein [Pannonibacter sp. Pt2-lr]
MRTWFDEMKLGERVELGSHHFTAEDIVRFASSFDPQPFHLTEEGAAATHFGRLCASGWHTASAFMRRLILTMQELDAETIARGETPVERGPSPALKTSNGSNPCSPATPSPTPAS